MNHTQTEKNARVHTYCLHGARAQEVELELQLTGGLMQRIIMSGLAGGALRESRERIRGCLERAGLQLPRRSLLANFAPADVPKQGNGFDLPLALGILALTDQVNQAALSDRAIVGEVALDGRLRPIRGALTLALAARQDGKTRFMLPWENGAEASLVDGLKIEAVQTIQQALDVLSGAPAPKPPAACQSDVDPLDLADVRGQASGRRALEIAALGGHNLLLSGPPGTGKTMLAQRLPGLLQPLTEESALEVSALHGLASGGVSCIVRHPPFRAPHHTISRGGLAGGGNPITPGELSLAHHGVLFLDEMPEFSRMLLETLRQPLEEGKIRLARAGRAVVFPAQVQLVGAMNPCPCGYRGHPRRGCRCSPSSLAQYRRRLSGPLLDRFDLAVDVPPLEADTLLTSKMGESTAAVRTRLSAAAPVQTNAPAVPKSRSVRQRLEQAIATFALSPRGMHRTIAVARTIARLRGAEEVETSDLDEALSFRNGFTREFD